MRRFVIALAAILAGNVALGVAIDPEAPAILSRSAPAAVRAAPAPATWNLILEESGNVYVMDSGLSLGDCWDNIRSMSQPRGGFSCEKAAR